MANDRNVAEKSRTPAFAGITGERGWVEAVKLRAGKRDGAPKRAGWSSPAIEDMRGIA